MKPRILVVDDDAGMRFLLEEQLTKVGWEVTTAADGAEALRIWSAEKFDALSTDFNMPKMTGIKLASEIWATNPTFPIFMFTGGNGCSDGDIAKDFISIGGRGFYEKLECKAYIAALAQVLKEFL